MFLRRLVAERRTRDAHRRVLPRCCGGGAAETCCDGASQPRKCPRLLDDKRTVLLEIPALKPVMQMSTRYGIKSADGTAVTGEIIHTIHALGE